MQLAPNQPARTIYRCFHHHCFIPATKVDEQVMATTSEASILQNAQTYYGSTIRSQSDLCTSACSVDGTKPSSALIKEALTRVHPHVLERFYGCGSPIPPAVEGITALDMGCGTGRDCYVLSQLVGPSGRVTGVDFNHEQVTVAQSFVDWHAEKFGFANVEFFKGPIEDLAALGIQDDSMDLVISNCALNLSPRKDKVIRGIFRVLKPGGELYFSDIFSDQRIPHKLMEDAVLHGECLAGAWFLEDLRQLLATSGCSDIRITSRRPIDIQNPDVREKLGDTSFSSCTVRAFKLSLEDHQEDYGQVVMYRGTIPDHMLSFQLDEDHEFFGGKRTPVSGNTAEILTTTRFAPHFEVTGNKFVHYGGFSYERSSACPGGISAKSSSAGCC